MTHHCLIRVSVELEGRPVLRGPLAPPYLMDHSGHQRGLVTAPPNAPALVAGTVSTTHAPACQKNTQVKVLQMKRHHDIPFVAYATKPNHHACADVKCSCKAQRLLQPRQDGIAASKRLLKCGKWATLRNITEDHEICKIIELKCRKWD